MHAFGFNYFKKHPVLHRQKKNPTYIYISYTIKHINIKSTKKVVIKQIKNITKYISLFLNLFKYFRSKA